MNEAWWFLQPGNIILLLVLLACLVLLLRWRGLATFLLFTALVVAMLPTVFGASDWLGWQLESRVQKPEELPPQVDGIIVLGGSIEWQISQEQGQLNLNAAAERMVAGTDLARRYPQAHLVLTGVYRETVPLEFRAQPAAQSMFSGPEFAGRQVTFIGEARSTYEEGLLALETVAPRPGETWLLVTSAMHMPRALAVFNTLGWSVTPSRADQRGPGERRRLDRKRNSTDRRARYGGSVREGVAPNPYQRTGRSQRGVG